MINPRPSKNELLVAYIKQADERHRQLFSEVMELFNKNADRRMKDLKVLTENLRRFHK